MKTLGISIDGVLRDMHAQFDKQYRKVFINNPNIVEMNKDMTVKERTEEDWEELEKKINLLEKELITLPIDSYKLTNHYKFEEQMSLDGETTLSPEEALEEFMNQKYPFQVFGQAEEFESACHTFNRIQAFGLDKGLYKTKLITCEKTLTIPATLHFLSKNACRVKDFVVVDEDYQKWDHCDVIIDCVPEVIQETPGDKSIIKIKHEFNKWDQVEHSFDSFSDITVDFMEQFFVGEKEA